MIVVLVLLALVCFVADAKKTPPPTINPSLVAVHSEADCRPLPLTNSAEVCLYNGP